MHVTEEKTRLRQDIKERIERIPEEQRHAEGRTLSRILLKEIPAGSSICAFFPLKTEVDIRSFLQEHLKRGDTLYLPVFDAKGLLFRRVSELTSLIPGELGIPEPTKDAPVLGNETVDYILIPGRAFDSKLQRLGRGSGGYDKWIGRYRSSHPHTMLYGVCLECQLVPNVPTEPHDIPMDAVLTCRGNIHATEDAR